MGAHDSPDVRDFASLFELLPIGAYRSSPDGTQLRANPALVRLNGYASEAEQLASVRDIAREWYVDPARREEFKRRMEAEGEVRAFESEIYRHRTRERIWISENAHAVRDAAGRVLFYEGTVEDITQRVRMQQALLEQTERWKAALEASGDGVWDWRIEEGVEMLSARCKALYGLDDNALSPHPEALDERTHPDDRAQMLADRAAHFSGRAPRYVNEHRVQHVDGRWIWVLSRGMVIERDVDGRPLRMVGTHTDITDRKLAEELRRERDRAAAADLAKTQFLARVSHELRTPLNAILGFGQLLELEPGGGDRQRGWVRQLLTSGRHLLALMDDILDLSGIQSGEAKLELEPVALRSVVEDCFSMLAGAAHEAGVTLHDEVALGDLLQVRADRRRLKQVLVNLVSNAIKYNRPGGTVRVSAVPDPAVVWLRVADTGSGLNPEQLARLFKPFERLGAQAGPVAGTGLGLALSRQLVEAMRGVIEVESTPGVGTRFGVRLPRA
jgi:PAS domain S-box-containing protein